MSVSLIEMFRVKDKLYSHTIDTETDGTSISDEDGVVILWVDSCGHLTMPGHGRVGKFHLAEDHLWSFNNLTGKALPETTQFGKDLLDAERELAKQYLENPNAYIEQTS